MHTSPAASILCSSLALPGGLMARVAEVGRAAATAATAAQGVHVYVSRQGWATHSTPGRFVMEAGGRRVEGMTLELRAGTYDLGHGKYRKAYPVPPGRYPAAAGERFGAFMLRLSGVPGFDGIQLHTGNYPWNSDACLLVGERWRRDVVVRRDVEMRTRPGVDVAERWRRAVAAGLVTRIERDGKGITDRIDGSRTKLAEMRAAYDRAAAAAARAGGKPPPITVWILNPGDPLPPIGHGSLRPAEVLA